MAITVKHTKVSSVPDSADTSLVRPSDWNDTHTLTGFGTAAELNAGVANGVATLDSGGKVPVSQIPQLGDLSYQGTWNASTNTPTLISSVGVKGFYYIVNVAGNTNLNGITDWQVGDWAVFDGLVWEKVDNTDAVTSVNGYTGTVVLTYSDVGAFPATSTTGTGNVVLQTSPTINTPTLSGATVDGSAPYMNYTPTTAPTYVEGRVFYDSSAHTLNYYNDNSQMSLNIGQEEVVRVRNQTGSAIANGQVVYVNGATGNTPTVALAIATSFSTSDIIGVATTDIANNGFGYVTISGLVNGLDLSAFADGNPVFLSATTAGALTATEPTAPNYSVQVGVVLRANPSVGTLLVATQQISVEVAHIVGQIQNSQLQNSNITINGNSTALGGSVSVGTVTSVAATAGTGISVSGSPITTSGTLTITNTAPDQTVAIIGSGGAVVTGTYPNFTITTPSGTVTSVSGTAPIASSGGNTPAISISQATTSTNGYLSSTDWNTFNNKQAAFGSQTANYFYAAPNGSSGSPTFRAVVAADIPTLNQNTTGSSGSCTGNSATVTNGVYTTGSYADPTWITSLAGSKISGTIDGGTF